MVRKKQPNWLGSLTRICHLEMVLRLPIDKLKTITGSVEISGEKVSVGNSIVAIVE